MDDGRRPAQFGAMLRTLSEEGVRFIVVGGVAAVLEGAPVSTFDLDIVPAQDEDNLERLIRALEEMEAVYFDPAGRTIHPTLERFHGGRHHLFRTRFGRLDVMQSIGDHEDFDSLLPRANPVNVGGVVVFVLSLQAVIETKEAAGRDKDIAVLALLRRVAAERDGNR